MPKCVQCGKFGLSLKLDAFDLCPDCQCAFRTDTENRIHELEAELKNLRQFYSEYSVILDAKAEAASIIASANKKLADTKVCTLELVADTEAHLAALFSSASKEFAHKSKSAIVSAVKSEQKSASSNSPSLSVFTYIAPSAFKKSAKNGYVVFDLETTGFHRTSDQIIEIGAIKYNGSFQEVSRFSELVHPSKPIPADATAINHITDKMVEFAPTIQEVLPAFIEFVGDFPLVAHNAPFDISFLEAATRICGLVVNLDYADSLAMARKRYELPSYRLDALTEYLGIQPCNAHRAIGDCEMLGSVLAHLLS